MLEKITYSFIDDWSGISPWIKSTSNELDLIFHVLASQLSAHLRIPYVMRNKMMYVLWWRTVYALTGVLFWCLFPSKITLSWAHKQFATRVHKLFYISQISTVQPLEFGMKRWFHSTLYWARDYFSILDEMVYIMMTSSNGNIFRVTGHLCGEFTGPRWIPRTKASKQSWGWWFERLSRPLWRQCNVMQFSSQITTETNNDLL